MRWHPMKLVWLAALSAGGVAAANPKPPDLLHVGKCSNGGYMTDFNCPEFLTAPGLPAIDPTGTQLAVGIRGDVGLSTLPNLTIQILAMRDGHTLSTIPFWSQKDSDGFAKKLDGRPSPQDVRPVTAAIEAKRASVEAALRGYKPLAKCKRVPDPSDDSLVLSACGGVDHWQCGDLDVRYAPTHTSIAVTRAGSVSTTDTRRWRHPPIEMGSGDQKLTVDTHNCISDLARVPNTQTLVVQLNHSCNEAGDWCYVGEQTVHIIK